jgi:hypothetical protein
MLIVPGPVRVVTDCSAGPQARPGSHGGRKKTVINLCLPAAQGGINGLGGRLGEDFPALLAGLGVGSLVAGYRPEAWLGAGGMAVCSAPMMSGWGGWSR